MDAGRLWAAERHFRLVSELLDAAGPELRNALEVSYLEDLAVGGMHACARYQAVKDRMPKPLPQVLILHHDQWR